MLSQKFQGSQEWSKRGLSMVHLPLPEAYCKCCACTNLYCLWANMIIFEKMPVQPFSIFLFLAVQITVDFAERSWSSFGGMVLLPLQLRWLHVVALRMLYHKMGQAGVSLVYPENLSITDKDGKAVDIERGLRQKHFPIRVRYILTSDTFAPKPEAQDSNVCGQCDWWLDWFSHVFFPKFRRQSKT